MSKKAEFTPTAVSPEAEVVATPEKGSELRDSAAHAAAIVALHETAAPAASADDEAEALRVLGEANPKTIDDVEGEDAFNNATAAENPLEVSLETTAPADVAETSETVAPIEGAAAIEVAEVPEVAEVAPVAEAPQAKSLVGAIETATEASNAKEETYAAALVALEDERRKGLLNVDFTASHQEWDETRIQEAKDGVEAKYAARREQLTR